MNNSQIKLHFRRFEFKYLLDKEKIGYLFADVNKFTRLDPYASKKEQGYWVNSLYFDSADFQAYYEKINGMTNRKKIRIRFYGKKVPKNVFLEIKRKQTDIIIKDRILSNINTAVKLINEPFYSALTTTAGETAKTFSEFFALKTAAFPHAKIMITYFRQPLISPFHDLRLTFDSYLKVARAKQLNLDTELNYQHILTDKFIFEIKFTGRFPYWLYQLVKKYQLQRTAVSKYCLGVANVYPNLYYE